MGIMGLIELIGLRYEHPELCGWTGKIPNITPNGILHGLRFEATVHWNNCKSSCDERCMNAGEMTAREYMKDVENGRPDLHPNDDSDVWSKAFEIHGTRQATCGRSGAMLPNFRNKSTGCNCYMEAYQTWIEKKQYDKLISMPIDPIDMYYEPRFE